MTALHQLRTQLHGVNNVVLICLLDSVVMQIHMEHTSSIMNALWTVLMFDDCFCLELQTLRGFFSSCETKFTETMRREMKGLFIGQRYLLTERNNLDFKGILHLVSGS